MWVGNEGQREPRTRSACSTSSTRAAIETPGTTDGVTELAEHALADGAGLGIAFAASRDQGAAGMLIGLAIVVQHVTRVDLGIDLLGGYIAQNVEWRTAFVVVGLAGVAIAPLFKIGDRV